MFYDSSYPTLTPINNAKADKTSTWPILPLTYASSVQDIGKMRHCGPRLNNYNIAGSRTGKAKEETQLPRAKKARSDGDELQGDQC